MDESHGDEVVWAGWAVGTVDRSLYFARSKIATREMVEFPDALVL